MITDTKFKPGESGNPDGRPKGSKDKRTQYREMFRDEAENLIKKAVEMAKDGDSSMMRLCIDRIVSPYRARDQKVKLDDLTGTLTDKGEKIIETMSAGVIAPSDAAKMLQVLVAQARIVELDELDKRVSRLEEKYVS